MFCEGAELGTAKEVLKKTLPKDQMPYPENGQAAAIGNRVLDEIGSIKLGLRDPDMAEVESLASALLMMSSSFGGTSGFSRTTDVGGSVQNGFEDNSRAFPAERQCPGCHLVQDCSEGEQGGAAIEFFASHLFR